jgi:glycosyltransferase involved in cell wall biosynthesis
MAKLGFDTNKVHTLSIGNYIGLYPNDESGDEARKKLGIDKKSIVFGMFGKIERYKGVIELIEKFNQLKLPNSELVIVGICPDLELKNQIIKLSKGKNNIKLFLSFIADQDIQTYINSFDILVYPFNNINTSSSIILSMSFSKPVICPRMGDLAELPNDTGIYYEIADRYGLSNSLKEACRQKYHLSEMGKVAYEYAKSLNWENIAKGTRNIYKSLSVTV